MRRLLALLLLPLLLLTACGGTEPTSASSEATASPTPTVTDLEQVTVEGPPGTKPEVTIDGSFETDTSERRVLSEGEGAVVEAGQSLRVDYLGVNGRDGSEFDTSYGKEPATFQLTEGSIIPGFLQGLVGSTVGSRLLVSVSPEDGYGAQGGVEAAGIEADDTLLFVIDVHAVIPTRAAGAAVAPPPGLPVVALAQSGAPTITVPKAPAPAKLLVQPLIKGSGPQVAVGQTITVHYTGVKWADGSVFDSSWEKGQTAEFPIGTGNVIAAWDMALVGQTVGSQILIVAPPAVAYPQGTPDGSITGKDTLVFVVDILDAR